jgi:hypothetical protein
LELRERATTLIMALRKRPARDDAAREIPLEERLRQKKLGFETNPSLRGPRGGGASDEEDGDSHDQDDGPASKKRRANKNCPLEITSKRAVGRFRQVVEVKKRKSHDPRFESMSGKLNEDLFAKSYAFLDEYKVRDIWLTLPTDGAQVADLANACESVASKMSYMI